MTAHSKDDGMREEIERLQETVTAWSFVIDGIRAHLQDRINMNDPASPATYMEIIDGYVRDIERSSQQYVNARWADANRYRREIESLGARLLSSSAAGGVEDGADMLEEQREAATEWMEAIGWLPKSYEGELHGVVEDAFAAGQKAASQRVERLKEAIVEARIVITNYIDPRYIDKAARALALLNEAYPIEEALHALSSSRAGGSEGESDK